MFICLLRTYNDRNKKHTYYVYDTEDTVLERHSSAFVKKALRRGVEIKGLKLKDNMLSAECPEITSNNTYNGEVDIAFVSSVRDFNLVAYAFTDGHSFYVHEFNFADNRFILAKEKYLKGYEALYVYSDDIYSFDNKREVYIEYEMKSGIVATKRAVIYFAPDKKGIMHISKVTV